MKGIKRSLSSLLIIFMLATLFSAPALADRSDNDHKKHAELKKSKVIKGKVNLKNDKVDYYKLDGQEGDNPRFVLTGSNDLAVYVYDDTRLLGCFKKSTKGRKFKIKGTLYE